MARKRAPKGRTTNWPMVRRAMKKLHRQNRRIYWIEREAIVQRNTR